jgi:hypothetical protein
VVSHLGICRTCRYLPECESTRPEAGSFLIGLTAIQAQTILAETRTTAPHTKIHESYGVGTHALPWGPADTGGTGSGAGG